MSKTHDVHKCVGLSTEFGRLRAERFRSGKKLGMYLETYNRLKVVAGFVGFRSHPPALIFLLICAGLSGCGIVSASNSDDQIEFGDTYEIRTSDPDSGEPSIPAIEGNRLVMVVSYSGGCEEHEFDLRSSVVSDAAALWLYHNANGDPCEAYLTEKLRMKVPENVLGAPARLLFKPGGGTFGL